VSLEALEKIKKKWRESAPLFLVLVQPLQATRAAAFANGVKACKGRATTKSAALVLEIEVRFPSISS
jgi:hypothetical protein